jgi:NitT/TauT family transport system substrate-binding protein
MDNKTRYRCNRREFLSCTSMFGAASLLGIPVVSRAEPPPETTEIRLVHAPAICLAPQYLAEDFLRMEGFTEVQYVKNKTGRPSSSIDKGEADFTQDAAPALLTSIDIGGSAIALAGVHVGCYELFAGPQVRGVTDLRGRIIAVPSFGSPDHVLMSSILAYIGIDPVKGVKWVVGPTGVDAVDIFIDGKADAYMAFAPQGHALREKGFNRVILNTALDRPWSQYFCCMVVARRSYVERHPVATKRALRAFLKATALCEKDPQRAARMLVDRGFESRYGVALEILKELSYSRWREANPEDTIRFHALRLHEVGIIKASPQKLIEQGTDWRFLNELKKELKA